ncbi:unnamed protein product [Amoebophrya sp. A120]|nr:unnamed protein product [Amoebophrya sp. A120]|eukprot:GSA120T00002331001.1
MHHNICLSRLSQSSIARRIHCFISCTNCQCRCRTGRQTGNMQTQTPLAVVQRGVATCMRGNIYNVHLFIMISRKKIRRGRLEQIQVCLSLCPTSLSQKGRDGSEIIETP